MPIDSKECFAALTEDGQLWEIYQAAQSGGGGGGITSINGDTTAAQLISGTAPITASTAAGTTTISTSMNTARLLGRTTAGVGVAEEITVGTGLSLTGGTLSSTVTGGVTSVTGTSPIASSGGTAPAISIADAAADGTTKGAAAFNANDFNSASGVISLDYTNGQSASASNKGFLTSTDWTTFNNKTGGSVGAVDNAVLRADVGTGIVQNSGLIVEDAIFTFSSVSGDATADTVTVTGSAFTNGTAIRFTSLTGGSGLNTSINYFVRGVSGSTFQLETFIGAPSAVNFTTNITAGAIIVGHSVQAFSGITGNATTDEITATGSALTVGTPVILASLTGGGSGISVNTLYTVRSVTGSVFTLSDSTGALVNFSAAITDGVLQAGYSVQTNVALSENTTETNSSLVLQPKGTGALIAGPKPDGTAIGGNARGSRAVCLQPAGRYAATQVASGADSVAIGTASTASGSSSIAIRGVATGNNAIAIGSTASGAQAISIGGEASSVSGANATMVGGYYSTISGTRAQGIAAAFSSATTDFSIIYGIQGLSNRYGMHAHSNGSFAGGTTATGDAQRARFVLRCKTTTNAAVEMALDGGTTYLGIPSGKVMSCLINISGVKSDGSAVAHYVRQYSVKNVGGTSSEVYAPITVGTDNAAGTTIALSANNGDDTLRIAVTGITSEVWRWVASVDCVEIAYGT